MPYAKLFRSRWAALLWAGGILWSAAEFVGASPGKPAVAANATTETDATGASVDANDLAILANALHE
ncbi:hypothetical protein AWL63_05795 [Sphingomonas panacis]|uniref:Uncharacterized protein n=1 Tax=Sphingomonas panacis TaxID=1560345 RepID=A0A1B3Z7Z7_9SPHN|nr:hypothetical protein [Sphingomonas panacis]AOH83554.1 hypothetical protein AWL63_05795 [Sphingomonas panacis]